MKINKKFKRTCAVALACILMLGAAPVSAAPMEAETTAPVVSYALTDENKVPAQLNVHVGEDAATSVNVTYTTRVETDKTTIAVTKTAGGETKYFEGTSYQGIGGKYIHEIVVTGLEACTEYSYVVGDGFNECCGTFKTALEQGDETVFTFAYLADTQVSNADNAEALGATLAKVNEMNPDFVYLAGDITDRATNEAII